MNDEKTHLLSALDDARDHLWALLDTVDPTLDIYPGWNKRDFFAHIAGWEAIMFEIFRDRLAGAPIKVYPYPGVDAENAGFVAARQSFSVQDAQLECEINRFALKTLLEAIPADGYGRSMQFPWGSDTVSAFLEGAVKHEHDHAQEIAELKQAGRL